MSIASGSLSIGSSSRINTPIRTRRRTRVRNPEVLLLLAPKPFLNPSIFHFQRSHFTNFAKAKSRQDYSDWSIRGKSLDLDPDVITALGGNENYSNNSDFDFDFDAFLSVLEFLCLASSLGISIILALKSGLSGHQKLILPWLGEKGLLCQCVFLVCGVFVGAIIRRRQWKRICQAGFPSRPVNLLERIEKVEKDLKSSATMLRFFSRQLEKLGIRFRLTKKSLKEPIAETAALARKNSEETRALAMQEDILEKELSEIQKVLLAMQEQQQKQLELILTIAKSGKLWDHGNNAAFASNSFVDGVPQPKTQR